MQELEALNPGVKIELGPSPDASPPSERQTSLSPQPEKTESTLPVRKRSRASKVERTASIRKSIATLNDADSNELDQLLSELWTIEHGLSDDSAFSTAPVTTAPAPSTVTTQEQGGPVDRQRTDTITHGGKKPVSHDDFSSFMASLAEGGSVVPDFSQFVKEPIYAEPRKVNPPPPPQPEVVPKPLSTEKSHESSPVKQVTPERVPGVPSVEELKNQLDKFVQEVEGDAQLGEEEKAERIKLEKMRIAMQKMKRAQFQQLVVKAVNADGSTKMAVVDEIMTAWDVCKLLVEKNRTQLGPNWTLIERLPSLQIERTLEDHENIIEALAHWQKGSHHDNQLHFRNNPDKYLLLQRPQLFVPTDHIYATGGTAKPSKSSEIFTEERKKQMLLKEFFVEGNVPKVEGEIFMKVGKHKWKKGLFTVRASGLYISKSGKSLALRDIARVVEWKNVRMYTGKNYTKVYKAPLQYCLSLVPNGPIQAMMKKVIHLCISNNKRDFGVWEASIRLAKYGKQLEQNNDMLKVDMPWLELESENLADPEDMKVTGAEAYSKVDLITADELKVMQADGTLTVRSKDMKRQGSGTLDITTMGGSHSPRQSRSNVSTLSKTSGSSLLAAGKQESVDGVSPTGTKAERVKPVRKNKLASMFNNAWEQGNLAEQMGQGTEKENSGRPGSTSEPIYDEKSGMFTLRRQKDKAASASNITNSPNASPQSKRHSSFSRSNSTSSQLRKRTSQNGSPTLPHQNGGANSPQNGHRSPQNGHRSPHENTRSPSSTSSGSSGEDTLSQRRLSTNSTHTVV